jgi:hypothetical protein
VWERSRKKTNIIEKHFSIRIVPVRSQGGSLVNYIRTVKLFEKLNSFDNITNVFKSTSDHDLKM